MKPFLYLLILPFCLTTTAYGQMPRNYLNLSFGSSSPMGQYAATGNVGANGYAAPGSLLSLDWAKYYGHTGLAARMSFGSHPLQEEALNHELGNIGNRASFNDSSKWMASCLMLGPSWGFVKNKFSFDLNCLGGFFFAKAPDVVIQNENRLPDKYWKFNNNPFDCVGALGYCIGGQVRYHPFNTKFHLSLKASFTHARPNYKVTSTYDWETTQQQTDYHFSQRTSIVDISFGLGFSYGKKKEK